MNTPAATPATSPVMDQSASMVVVRRAAIAIAVLALIAVPYAIQQVYYVNIASQVLLYAVFALGLNVLVGYAGLVSLGHAGLFGVAAYVVAYLLAAGHGHPFAILGGLAAGLVGTAGFAALALRATGISFIMITLALGEIIWGLAYRWISITGGDNGISVSTRPAPFGLSLDSPRAFYVATLIVFLLAVVSVRIFVRSPFGAALCGTRDQPRRMNALGYHVWMIRFWAFMFSGSADLRRRHSVRLLHRVHQPAGAGADRFGGRSADGDFGRRRNAAGAGGRCGAGGHRQERGQRLYHALEFHAWRDFRRHRRVHAGRLGARCGAADALGLALGKPAERRDEECGRIRREAAVVTALAVNSLCKSFGGLRVTTDVNLNVAAGERRLIIGPNGAGKTTLFNLITGEITPDSGSVALFGRDITRTPSRKRSHLGMARTYQIITLFAHDTIERNVMLALLGQSPLRWNPLLPLDRQRHLIEQAHAALNRVGLDHIAARPLAQTSYGERRRVEIAMALAQNPKLLLLDEPFAGLSIDERQDVRKLLAAIPRDVTIVMIEHDMDTALDLADRITLLHFGEVIVEGTRAEVVADPRTREVYLGE